MAQVAYGLPFAPPNIPAPAWGGMTMKWTGWDGSEWAISDSRSGVVLMAGTRGLTMPPSQRVTHSSPARPGSRHEGSITYEREVFWPLKVFHGDGSLAWIERDRAFRKTLDPDRPGVWSVTQPSGETRELTCYFDNEGNQAFDTIPSLVGWARYGIYLAAEQPFWVGQPVVKAFAGSVPPDPFFEPDGPQIVNIASGFSVSNARMDNPGDVESYPRWFIEGPATTASVGVGDVVVDVPFEVPAGKTLVIESDPDSIGATMYDIAVSGEGLKPSDRVIGVDLVNPVDMTSDLGEADFAAIPAGSQVPLSLTLVGLGKVEALLPTLWRAAW